MAAAHQRILIGVSGGIAAYKACDVVSELRKRGHPVHVVMTQHATRLVSPLTFETLSHQEVVTSLFDSDVSHRPDHIALRDDAALLAVIPATANVIAKAAAGIADDALTTLLLAVRCPVLWAPAMNTAMWNHPTVTRNLGTLRSFGHHIVEPAAGELACGDMGMGKLAPVHEILKSIDTLLAK